MSSFGKTVVCGAWIFLLVSGMGCGAPDEAATPPAPVASPEDPLTMGKRLHETIGCATCHSLDGRKRTAGTYKGIYGTPVELADGSTAVRHEVYLRRSILDADAEIVKGYADVMPDYAETLSAQEVDALLALIKSVGPEAETSAEAE